MTQQELLRDFLTLSPDQQQAVLGLIVSFHRKNQSSASGIGASIDFSTEPFVGLWKTRQDLADSSEWVRELRRTEW